MCVESFINLIQIVKEDYQEKQAQSGHTQPIDFESDKITLDIPMTGVSSEGWKINPLFPPVVSYKDKSRIFCQINVPYSPNPKGKLII